MADRTAAALHSKLVKALDLLDDAEVRFAAAQDRAKAKLRRQHPRMDEQHVDKLGPIAARGEDDMANAMADWSLAHQRVQSYAAALSAMSTYALALRAKDGVLGQIEMEHVFTGRTR